MTDVPGLTIAATQPPCRAYDVAENAASHADVVLAAAARVVVFPELSLTGYELDAPAVDPDDDRLRPVIDADGARVAYRKMWLSAEEAERFVPGSSPVVLDVDGWRLGLAICKDTGIPEHSEATARVGMDVYVAGVLDSADDASVQEQRARRIASQHRVWVAVASFAGSAGGGYEAAAAQSRIWSPSGVVVASAGHDVGRVARATLTKPATA